MSDPEYFNKFPNLAMSRDDDTLNQKMRRRILEGVPYGMALEGLTAPRLGRS